ncbi:hypothetical protein AB0L59_39485 [Streptomyces sp. NPDC052109]|uniref:hypothetical protein n=1 Tax=Streptomyces sp. NPDC052109 TaxID=3155527 RepID=UPI00341A60FE
MHESQRVQYPADTLEAQVMATRWNGGAVMTERVPANTDEEVVRARALRAPALRARLDVRN